jgi:hydroxyacylglutathione hydrolase
MRKKIIEMYRSERFGIDAVAQGYDNYAYVIFNPLTRQGALVDALEGETLFDYEERFSITITTVFNTHHHPDHVGANRSLYNKRSKSGETLSVYGGAYDGEHGRIPHQNHVVKQGDQISWESLVLEVVEIPGHTLGHIGYFLEGHFFCGDTVFLAGCGRLFEGTPSQMFESIHHRIGILGLSTKLYSAHEYSLQNLRFAQSLYDEEALQNWTRAMEDRLQEHGATLPTTIEDEFKHNPFFRVADPIYRESLSCLTEQEKADPIRAFAKIRALKDVF